MRSNINKFNKYLTPESEKIEDNYYSELEQSIADAKKIKKNKKEAFIAELNSKFTAKEVAIILEFTNDIRSYINIMAEDNDVYFDSFADGAKEWLKDFKL